MQNDADNPVNWTSPAPLPGNGGPGDSFPQREPIAPIPFANFPEDLRVPWRWLDIVFFLCFGFFTLLVIEALGLLILTSSYGMDLQQAVDYSVKNARLAVLRQSIWFTLVMLFLFANIRVRFRESFWQSIRWVRSQAAGLAGPWGYLRWLGFGAVLAILVSAGSRLVARDTKLPIEDLFTEPVGVMLIIALGTLGAPLVEEIVFRGFLYPVIARTFGVTAGVILTGLTFGLIHAPQLWGGWGQIGLLCLVGIAFTYARARTGSLIPAFLLHLGYNVLLFIGLLISTNWLKNLPPAP